MSATADPISSQSILLREDDDGIATLTLNRPAQYNALSGELLTELQTALDEIERDDSVRVVISDRGAGPADDAITEPAADAMRGRGRWIMSRWCDSVSYERTRTGFRTVLTKHCATQAA